MKNTLTFIAVVLFILGVTQNLMSLPEGSPAAYANDKSSNFRTCATSGCHSGTAVTNSAATITSNIPSTGYVPGQTYTFTATVNKPTYVRFGFQASPQDSVGNYKGTMIVTNTTKTKITGTKYITHTQSGNNQSSWSWNWVAPALGSGQVKMSGALMAANNNGGTSGDSVYKVAVIINECFKSPTNLVGVPKGTSVTLSWTKNTCATGYKIMYRAVGAATWKYVTLPDTNQRAIFGLAYSTDYEYAIASINGTITSAYSTMKYFSTYCQCFNPIVVIDSIGTNGVKFYIDDDSCGVRYRIQYRMVGKPAWVTKIVGDTVNTLVVTGLVANTPYEFRARRECNVTGTYTSVWNLASPFNTNLRIGFNEDDKTVVKTVVKTVDVLGREISPTSSGIVIYIYSDGSMSRKYNVER